MFAVLAWTAVEMERICGLATLKTDVLAAMHESPFAHLASLSPRQVRDTGVIVFGVALVVRRNGRNTGIGRCQKVLVCVCVFPRIFLCHVLVLF